MEYYFQFPLLTLLGSLVLGLFGLRMLIRAMSVALGPNIRSLLNSVSPSHSRTWGISWLLNLSLFSPQVSQIFWLSFANTGLLSLPQAIIFTASSYISFAFLLLILLISFYWPAWITLALGGALYFLLKPRRSRGFAEILFSHGLSLLAFQTLVISLSQISANEAFRPFIFFITNDSLGPVLLITLFSYLLSLVLRATSFSIFIAAACMLAGVISLTGATAIVFGEMLACGSIVLLQSFQSSRDDGRRLAVFAQFYPLGFALLSFGILPFVVAILTDMADPFMAQLGLNPVGYLGSFVLWMLGLWVLMGLAGFLLSPLWLRLLSPKASPLGPKAPQKLIFVNPEMGLSPALSIELLNEEVLKLSTLVYSMLTLSSEAIFKGGNPKIDKYEEITDNVQDEVQKFLIHLSQHPLVQHESVMARSLMKMTSSLESIADECRSLVGLSLKHMNKIHDNEREEFLRTMDQVKLAYEDLFENFDQEAEHKPMLLQERFDQQISAIDEAQEQSTSYGLFEMSQSLLTIIEKLKNIEEAKKLSL